MDLKQHQLLKENANTSNRFKLKKNSMVDPGSEHVVAHTSLLPGRFSTKRKDAVSSAWLPKVNQTLLVFINPLQKKRIPSM
jgi:hypothetical protein